MKIDNKNFCAVPFVQLNTRGKGNARVCCSIGGLDYGIPKELTIDQLSPDNYNAKTDVYNLGTDKIEALWSDLQPSLSEAKFCIINLRQINLY